jgi:hypothetical protein
MEVTVEGNDPTSHSNLLDYADGDSFALISGATVEYCTITLQHIDAETGLTIIDDETTEDGAICGQATLEIKASSEVLDMHYAVESAIGPEGTEISLPLTATNTADGMVYKIFYKPIEIDPEEPGEPVEPETDNADTSDAVIKSIIILASTLLSMTGSVILARKAIKR